MEPFELSNFDSEKFRRKFFKQSMFAITFVWVMQYLVGDPIILIALKSAFAPIIILALLAQDTFWPNSHGKNPAYIVIRSSLSGLWCACAILIVSFNPERSIESHAISFAIGFVIFTVAMAIRDYFPPFWPGKPKPE